MCNSPKLEITQIFVKGRMDKDSVLSPNNVSSWSAPVAIKNTLGEASSTVDTNFSQFRRLERSRGRCQQIQALERPSSWLADGHLPNVSSMAETESSAVSYPF